MITRIPVAILALSLSLQLQAQFTISGTVTNESGEELPSAHITLPGTLNVLTSGRDGSFEIKNIREGVYTIEVSFIGYEKWRESIPVKGDTSILVVLSESKIMAEEVIVRASRANQNDPVAYTNIDRGSISGSDRARDIPYVLELTPSVVVTSDAGTGIGYSALRIRGTDPSRINVTVNGIPYNDSESHDVYWVDIPDFVSSTENIQVQRGVGTSTQGAGAFGANINFQSSSVSPVPYAELQSVAGSYNTFKNSLAAGTGLINDHLSVDMRLSQISSDGYIDRAFANMQSYYLSAGWYGENNILRLTSFSGKELTYQAWGGVPAELLESDRTYNPYTYDNEVDDYKQSHYQLHWSWQPVKPLNLNMALHYTLGKGYYEQFREDESFEDYNLSPVIIGNDSLTESDIIRRKWLDNGFYGGVINGNYTNGALAVTAGGGWNRYDGDHFGRIIWSEFSPQTDIRHQYYFNNGLKTDWNTFARVNYSLLSGLKLYADIQFRRIDYSIEGIDDDQRDITQGHVYNFLNPKTGMSFEFGNNQELYFSYSVGNREPKRSNFTDARPGDVVRPERLHDFELGHKYFSSVFSLGINAYFMDYKDQLVLTGEINDVGSAIMVNVPDSYRAGLEIVVALKPFDRLSWQANLTVSRNRIEKFVEYVDDWDTWGQQSFEHEKTSLAFSPEIIASSRISWIPVKNLDLSLRTKYVGKQYMDNTSSSKRMLNPYLVNNVRVSYLLEPVFLGKIRLFAELINALNEKYESNAWVYSYFYEGARSEMIGYYPQAGRHFMAGITIDL